MSDRETELYQINVGRTVESHHKVRIVDGLLVEYEVEHVNGFEKWNELARYELGPKIQTKDNQ